MTDPLDLGTSVATEDEMARLASIQRRGTWLWRWPLIGVPLILVVGLLFDAQVVLVVALSWIGVGYGLACWHCFSRCPRCRQFFNWSERERYSWSDACVHCGLQLNATRSGLPR